MSEMVQEIATPRQFNPGPTLDTPVRFLKGVGAGRATLLEGSGLGTVRDLMYFFPFRYEDRRHPMTVRDLRNVDQPVTLRGRVISAGVKISPVKRLHIFEAILDDGTGILTLVWFNQPYLETKIQKNDRLAIYGQPRLSNRGRLQIENPDWEKLGEEDTAGEGTIVPVYSNVNGIPAKAMRRFVLQSLEAIRHIEDPLPEELRRKLKLPDLPTALLNLHYPQEIDERLIDGGSPAHRRMIFQEFFAFQLALRLRRATEERQKKRHQIVIDDEVRAAAKKVIPFKLTEAQKRVLKEIATDMQSSRPMYRLVQGDVGSGKTIVAVISAVLTIENGHQAALLAPTEVLAEQHYQRIRQLVDGSSIRLAKLSGSTPAAEKKAILHRLQHGDIDFIVGTHALLEEKVRFKSLRLAIVDEQHRFGVAQRQKLFEKGELPDILVMTATPIPRSLALALYGDLELSVIDELPPGRTPIKTVVRGTLQLPKIHAFINEELAAGAQVYVVYPIIEESEKVDLKPITKGFAEFEQAFPHRRVGMLHGRMPAAEKELTMARFKKGEIDILVATTVIEVGIDVPNASIMLIVDADRFGLSQLHQLRGRVGRGTRKSYCILLRDERAAEEAKERLRIFEKTKDGFEVAEKDLQQRGAGDFFGTRQSGMPRFRFGDILRDHRVMERARDEAMAIIENHGIQYARRLTANLIGREAGGKD